MSSAIAEFKRQIAPIAEEIALPNLPIVPMPVAIAAALALALAVRALSAMERQAWPFYARRLLSNPEQILYHRLEAHHIVPLSSTGIRTTRLSDLALLCANCHRLLHRAIAIEKRWLTVAEGKAICGV